MKEAVRIWVTRPSLIQDGRWKNKPWDISLRTDWNLVTIGLDKQDVNAVDHNIETQHAAVNSPYAAKRSRPSAHHLDVLLWYDTEASRDYPDQNRKPRSNNMLCFECEHEFNLVLNRILRAMKLHRPVRNVTLIKLKRLSSRLEGSARAEHEAHWSTHSSAV